MQLHNDKITTLQTAIQTAYLDHTINSNLAYRPEFVYSCAGVPLFRRNGNRQSGGRKPLNRNRDTALKCLLPASLLA